MVRVAQLRDIGKLHQMFKKLIDYLVSCGQDWFEEDMEKLNNSIVGYIIDKLMPGEHIVLVYEKEEEIRGFLFGSIIKYPAFFKHTLVAKIDWLYPVSPIGRKLAHTFQVIAQKRGATVEQSESYVNNKVSINGSLLDKREAKLITFTKLYACSF